MPFSSLPHDILRDIFMKTKAIRGPYTKIPTKIPTVVMLSQIAPFTRRIVHNEALLWTTIDDQVVGNLEYLYLHLDLSRHCPLDISFHPDPYSSDELDVLPNLAPLLAHSDRWRWLHLRSWSKRALNATVKLLRYMRPQMLEELTVTWEREDPDYESVEEDKDIQPFFQCDALCLKKLSLTGVPCLPSIIHNLTDLRLASSCDLPMWSYSDFVSIISKMVSLTKISMDGPVVRVGNNTIKNPESIALPNLQSLALRAQLGGEVGFCRYLAAMLALFSSSPLKSLEFEYEADMSASGYAVQHIIADLSSGKIGFPQMTCLVIELEDWMDDDVRRFILALPSIERLFFQWHAHDILDALLSAPDTEDLFPHLHAIYLTRAGDPGPGSVLHKVRKLAESRMASGKPLQELWIRQSIGTRPSCDDVDWIQGHVHVQWVASEDWDRLFALVVYEHAV